MDPHYNTWYSGYQELPSWLSPVIIIYWEPGRQIVKFLSRDERQDCSINIFQNWLLRKTRPEIHTLILCFECWAECLVFLLLWSDSTIGLSWGRCYVDCYPLYSDISTDCENQVSKYLVTDYRQLKEARPCGLWLWFWCHARYWTTVHYSILFYTIYITSLYYVPQMVGSAEGEMLEKNLIRNISWLAVSYAGSSVFCFVVYKIHSNASKVYWLMLMFN